VESGQCERSETREKRDEFWFRLKQEWRLMWMERFDDRVKAEGVAVQDYPLVFMSRGDVIFASRDAKTPSFSEIRDFWASQGLVYAPDPNVGGWGKFAKTYLVHRSVKRRAAVSANFLGENLGKKQQLKKGGRGWLHLV